jgi:Acetokinase family/Enoyl-(Acyl carrier protein) reductase
METILVVNAGSSSVKFEIFALEPGGGLRRHLKGQADGIGTRPRLRATGPDGTPIVDRSYAATEVTDVPAALILASAWQREEHAIAPIAVGHRVLHGGPDYDRPTLIDDAVLARLERYVCLAPLHQPHNLAPIRSIRALFPNLPQVACFDTAFHRGHGALADHLASAFAVDYFVYRAALLAGMLTSALGGLDAFVFTAGIGESAAPVRARLAERLGWLGVRFDADANAANAAVISPAGERRHRPRDPDRRGTDDRPAHLDAALRSQCPPTNTRERMMAIPVFPDTKVALKGRKGLVVGIANEHSIAWGCTKAFRALGADLAVTYLNDKAKKYVEPLARELESPILMPLDVRAPGQMEAVFARIEKVWGRLDFVVHSIAFSPREALQGRVVDVEREGFLILLPFEHRWH